MVTPPSENVRHGTPRDVETLTQKGSCSCLLLLVSSCDLTERDCNTAHSKSGCLRYHPGHPTSSSATMYYTSARKTGWCILRDLPTESPTVWNASCSSMEDGKYALTSGRRFGCLFRVRSSHLIQGRATSPPCARCKTGRDFLSPLVEVLRIKLRCFLFPCLSRFEA